MSDNRQSENIIESAGYEPALIANYFISISAIEGKPVCPMKMLKLVYIAYAWYYTIFGKTLFKEEVEAWMHGPVVPSLYHEFKRFGKKPITSLATLYEDGEVIEPLVRDEDDDLLRLLPLIWRTYQNASAWELRQLTHQDNSPWHKVYQKDENNVIRLQDMKERSEKKLNEVLRER